MTPKRIRIEMFPNTDIRRYYATAQISREQLQGGVLDGDRCDPFRVLSFNGENKELTNNTKAVVMKFYDISAVESVGLNHNTARIKRSQAFDWSDFEQDIIATIKIVVGWTDEDEVTVEYLIDGTLYDYEPLVELDQYITRQRQAEAAYARLSELF